MIFSIAAVTIGSALGVWGAKKGYNAYCANSDANDANDQARSMIDQSIFWLLDARSSTREALVSLGEAKGLVYRKVLTRFVAAFKRIKNVVYEGRKKGDVGALSIDKTAMAELQATVLDYGSITAGSLGGVAAGGAMALAAYGGVGALGATCATTGTAIGGLSGAAATNATLAWLGGGALSASGGGMALGACVLGGIVAGPALLATGWVFESSAQAKLEAALGNLAEAKKICEQHNAAREVLIAINLRAGRYRSVITKLELTLLKQIKRLEVIIDEYGVDFRKYGKDVQGEIYALLGTVAVMKGLLETPLLDKKGNLTAKSESVLKAIDNAEPVKGARKDSAMPTRKRLNR